METSPSTTTHPPEGASVSLAAHHPELGSERPARRRGAVLTRALAMGDAATAVIASILAMLILGTPHSVGSGIGFTLCIGVLWPLVAFSIGLYRSDQLAFWASAVAEIPRAFVAMVTILWPVFGLSELFGLQHSIERTFVIAALIAAIAALTRTAIRAVLHRRTDLLQRTLILGSGFVSGEVSKKLQNNQQFGLVPVGILDDDVHQPGTPDLPLLGRIDDLDDVIAKAEIDRVIITFTRARHEQLLEAIRACRDASVTVDIVPRLFEFLDGVQSLDQVGGLPLLSIGTAKLTPGSIFAKRVLDIVGSLTLIILATPVMIAIAIAIRLGSRGPIFFRQPRAGRDQSSFQLLKFRSMYIDAEERKQAIASLNESTDGVMFKIREDPRVTRVGRVIRRYSLDELPQLFNVLKGDMSLVGPRPLIFPETAALEKGWHQRRLELRPGLTGPWQVYGRSQSPFEEMVRFDYQYVVGWSLARDIELLLATVPAVISGRGAY